MSSTANLKEQHDLIRITYSDVDASRKFNGDSDALKSYWNDRYASGYAELLEDKSLFGRHGVIAEYVNRFSSKARLLDAGCGTGILSGLINTERFSYTGIDIANMAINFALNNRNRDSVKFLETSIEDFEPNHTFDVIVMNEVLYYLDLTYIFDQLQTWLSGQKMIISSILDFPIGDQIIQDIKSSFRVLGETKVQGDREDLKWTILAYNAS